MLRSRSTSGLLLAARGSRHSGFAWVDKLAESAGAVENDHVESGFGLRV
ncbi:hypothetical protein [Streptomyces sp. CA-256286]|nr:hypothetical protein [Streptomyces sp. CA-256286]